VADPTIEAIRSWVKGGKKTCRNERLVSLRLQIISIALRRVLPFRHYIDPNVLGLFAMFEVRL
jgi:hypothetical protein